MYRSRRRTRFTATLTRHGSDAIEKRVILAYDGPSVGSHYALMGFTVLKVERGDYRKEARKDERAAGGGWTLDRAALREAIDFLGITRPVTVKPTSRKGGRYGAHQLRGMLRGRFMRGLLSDFDNADDVGHYITVKSWLTPDQAGRTLWHELCHAMQAEQAMGEVPAPHDPRSLYDAWRTCSERGRGIGYERKPIEVEAREYESFNAEKPLAR